jgi:hypothetical protein
VAAKVPHCTSARAQQRAIVASRFLQLIDAPVQRPPFVPSIGHRRRAVILDVREEK